MRDFLTRWSAVSSRFTPRWAPGPFVERWEDRLVPAIVARDAIDASCGRRRSPRTKAATMATRAAMTCLATGDLAIDASGGCVDFFSEPHNRLGSGEWKRKGEGRIGTVADASGSDCAGTGRNQVLVSRMPDRRVPRRQTGRVPRRSDPTPRSGALLPRGTRGVLKGSSFARICPPASRSDRDPATPPVTVQASGTRSQRHIVVRSSLSNGWASRAMMPRTRPSLHPAARVHLLTRET